jgi:hypothetical protein
VTDRLQALLALLGDLLPATAVQPPLLLPLLRACASAVAAPGLPLLQANAVGEPAKRRRGRARAARAAPVLKL